MMETSFRATDDQAHFWLRLHRKQLADRIGRLRHERSQRPLRPRALQFLGNSLAEAARTEEELARVESARPDLREIVYDFERGPRRHGLGAGQGPVHVPPSRSDGVPEA